MKRLARNSGEGDGKEVRAVAKMVKQCTVRDSADGSGR